MKRALRVGGRFLTCSRPTSENYKPREQILFKKKKKVMCVYIYSRLTLGSFLKFENTQKAALHRPALPIPRDTDRQTDR